MWAHFTSSEGGSETTYNILFIALYTVFAASVLFICPGWINDGKLTRDQVVAEYGINDQTARNDMWLYQDNDEQLFLYWEKMLDHIE